MADRKPKLTTVLETTRLTPRMVRIVLGGEDHEGFGAGAFTDHYVKLMLPPAGAPYTAPSTLRRSRPSCPAPSGRACARSRCATGIPTGGG
jgi:NADPH-dependent ferric siderophore reductase